MFEWCNTYNSNLVCDNRRFLKTDHNSAHLESSGRRRTEPSEPQWINQQVNSQFSCDLQQSTMYGEHNQYPSQGYQTTYGTYSQNYPTPSNYNPYQGYSQATGYPSSDVQPVPPGDEYPHAGWEPVRNYHDVNQLPTTLNRQTSDQSQNQQLQDQHDLKQDNKRDAVAQELKQQKAQMAKQRDDYVKKIVVLRRELDLLKAQKQELLAEHSSNHDNNYIMKENNKLQNKIQSKMKTINNVIEMLTNIIGDNKNLSELEAHLVEGSPMQHTRRSMSISAERPDSENRFNYVHYDPELHWCRICDVFPKSAKDLLVHLHSKEHKDVTQERDMVDTPWHKLPSESEMPYYEGAPKKRLPIKGLQFFISATAWYCKLCDVWMGDLHCASQHLKSQNHNQNYTNFVEQNPHWELEWLKDRERALSRTENNVNKATDSDDDILDRHKKKRSDKHSLTSSGKESKKKRKKSRKKKKHARSSDSSSSSSSSDSSSEGGSSDNDKSKSIRVAMRNKMKLQAQMIMKEDLGGKWEVFGRLVEEERKKKEMLLNSREMGKESEVEDTLINQWMTVKQTEDKDKKLLDNLKDRMRQKQEAEKIRLAQLEQKRIEKEREEQEMREKKEREEKEQKEREELQRREMEEMRLRERDRIKFKTKDKYRRRYSPTEESPDDSSPSKEIGGAGGKEKMRRSRSQSPEKRRHRERSHERYHHRKSNDRHHSKSPEDHHRSKRSNNRSPSHETDSGKKKRKPPPPPPPFKKLPFIGRMPLFKNKKPEEKPEKEIKKEDYDQPRQTRFQPGNLARAFIPDPDVVCFPKLSTIPPIMEPPPPPPSLAQPRVPSPPKISEKDNDDERKTKKGEEKKSGTSQPKANGQQEQRTVGEKMALPPPFPTVTKQGEHLPQDFQDALNFIYPDQQQGSDMSMSMAYGAYSNMDYEMMYGQHSMYDYSADVSGMELGTQVPPLPPPPPTIEHTMPLQPPPLPPDDPNDDLALLGISADDMAAQMF